MTLQQLPVTGLDDINHRRRHRETTNQILTHQFDDSKVQTAAERLAGVTPVNFAYPPGDIRRYGTNTTPGTTDMTSAFTTALALNKRVYVPEAAAPYYVSGPFIVNDSNYLYGDGRNSQIITDLDIEMVNCNPAGVYNVTICDLAFINQFPVSDVAGPTFTATTTSGSSILTVVSSTVGLYKGAKISGTGIPGGTYIRYISGSTIRLGDSTGTYVNATANGVGISMATTFRRGATKFHLYLNNAGRTLLDNLYVKGNFQDTDYHTDNHGGVWFDRDTLAQYFINEVTGCWFDHAQVLMGTSDSNIKNSHIWGVACDYGVKLCAPGLNLGGCNISNGQIAAVWITATAKESFGSLNQNIVGNNIDGGGLWESGYGVFAMRSTNLTISGNRINICWKAGIYLETPFGVDVTGNHFADNNLDGISYSDIEIDCVAFQPLANTITGNSFAQNFAKTPSIGWAIREINSGSYPAGHAYDGNAISGNYASPAFVIATPISTAQAANCSGNAGGGMQGGITGTFTPAFVGSTTAGAPTYTTRSGEYRIVNNRVTGHVLIITSALGGMVGNVTISGLPVASGSTTDASCAVGQYSNITMGGAYTQLTAIISTGASAIRLLITGSGLAASNLTAGMLAAVTLVEVSFAYDI